MLNECLPNPSFERLLLLFEFSAQLRSAILELLGILQVLSFSNCLKFVKWEVCRHTCKKVGEFFL